MKMKRIFFIAGGSGITPIYQTIAEIIKMKTKLTHEVYGGEYAIKENSVSYQN